MAALGLRCCVRAYSRYGEQQLLCLAARASHCTAALVVKHGLRSYGAWA